MRTFTLQDFFKYYDNEIYEANIGLKGKTFFVIFECKQNCSPIFKIDIFKSEISRIYEAKKLLNNIEKESNSITTALSCSSFFYFKNSFHLESNNVENWDWWDDVIVCEYKEISSNKIFYTILHIDELKFLKKEDIDFTLSQYDFTQLFKKPITYFRKRNQLTEHYSNIEWKSYFWAAATGIGVISGGNSYRCIDIDGCSSINFVKKVLTSLGIQGAYDWIISTGSNNGFHIWIKTKDLPSNLLMNSHAEKLFKNAGFIVFEPNEEYKNIFKRIELRWECHIIMPPSVSGYGFSLHNS